MLADNAPYDLSDENSTASSAISDLGDSQEVFDIELMTDKEICRLTVFCSPSLDSDIGQGRPISLFGSEMCGHRVVVSRICGLSGSTGRSIAVYGLNRTSR